MELQAAIERTFGLYLYLSKDIFKAIDHYKNAKLLTQQSSVNNFFV